MANITQLTIIDPSIHATVAADHQPREARHRVTYDDGTTSETTLMLYWNGANVRSCTLAEWDTTAQAEIAEGEKRSALRAQFQAAARAHVGKNVKQLTLPQLLDMFALYLERDGLIDSDGNITEGRERK